MTIGLQAEDGIAISSDGAGVVRTWDITTGLCKESVHTSAGPLSKRDVQMIGGKLIIAWCSPRYIYIVGAGKYKELRKMDKGYGFSTTTLRISEDGSKLFLLDREHIQAICTETGAVVGEVRLEGQLSNDLPIVEGSMVWVHFKKSPAQGWDFGVSDSTPIQLSSMPPVPDRPRLDFIFGTKKKKSDLCRIEDTTTGKVVYQLPRRYGEPTAAQWDGRYLVTGYKSGEVLILDFKNMIPQ